MYNVHGTGAGFTFSFIGIKVLHLHMTLISVFRLLDGLQAKVFTKTAVMMLLM